MLVRRLRFLRVRTLIVGACLVAISAVAVALQEPGKRSQNSQKPESGRASAGSREGEKESAPPRMLLEVTVIAILAWLSLP